MPRFKPKPLTRRELEQDGPDIRLRDLAAICGMSKDTIRADIASGDLVARQHRNSPRAPYYVERTEARRWLAAMFHVKLTT